MAIAKLSDERQKQSDQRIIEQIDALIRGPHGPSHIFTITPGVAQDLLERYNIDNRSRRSSKLTEYASDMTDGVWKITGDTIKFSDRQLLRDGQHRLAACVKSGKPFTTHFVFGMDDKTFLWLDKGKVRDGSDALQIMGVDNHRTVASMMRWLEMFRQDRVKERLSLTQAETAEAYHRYDRERLGLAVMAARKVYSADNTPKSLAGALYYLFAEKDSGLAREFFEAWATRNFGGRMKPLKKASEFLATLHTASDGRVHDTVRAAVWVVAWNMVITKRVGTAPDFRWRSNMPFPGIKG